MKLKFLLILLVFLLPRFVFAFSCSNNGYTILAINWIFTEENDAKTNTLDWLGETQEKDGYGQNNIRDTAFLLYSISSGSFSGSGGGGGGGNGFTRRDGGTEERKRWVFTAWQGNIRRVGL